MYMDFTTKRQHNQHTTYVFFENEKASDNKKTISNKNFIGCIAKSAFFSFFISAAAFVVIINFLTETI